MNKEFLQLDKKINWLKIDSLKEWNAIWSNMDGLSVILSEVRQRKRNIARRPLYVESKKKWNKWTYLKNRERLTDIENELTVAGGKRDS